MCLRLGDHNATIAALIDGQFAAICGIALVDHLDGLPSALIVVVGVIDATAAAVADVATHHNAILLDQLAIAAYG